MPFTAMPGYPKIVKLTHKLANEFAEMEPAPGDREERQWRRDEIARCVKDGTFRAPEWASAICKETGKEYRVNGKHTSKELAEMNGSLPSMSVMITRFECDTLHDVAEVYNTYDKTTGVRSARDNVRAFQMTSPELAAIPTRYVSSAVSGMSFALWEGKYHPQDDKSNLMFAHPDFCKFVYEICMPKSGRIILRTAVVAAMFKSFQKSQSAAKEFWLAVREASGHPASVPDRKLNHWLLVTSMGTGRGATKGKQTAGMHQFLCVSLQCWNAYRRGDKTVNIRYVIGMKTPAAI